MTRAEHLFSLLGGLDDELIEEAAQPIPAARPRFRPNWARWGTLCACLLLAVGIWRISQIRMGSSASPPGANEAAGDYGLGSSGSADPGEQAPNGSGQEEPTYGATGDGDVLPPQEAPYGTLLAEDTGPMDDQPYQLYYRESDSQWTLTHREDAIDLTDYLSELSGLGEVELSDSVYFAVNDYPEEDGFYPAEHVSYENYVLIAFMAHPGQSTCLVVGLNADGSFEADENLYLSHSE